MAFGIIEIMKYFAYGSNMDPARMLKRKTSFTERIPAKLKGYKLMFNKQADRNPKEGYANLQESKNKLVEGVLYNINEVGRKKIDLAEGYPDHYNRIKVKVELASREEIEVETYIANPNKTKSSLKPSKEYLGYLLKAKDVLSKEYYTKLELTETLD